MISPRIEKADGLMKEQMLGMLFRESKLHKIATSLSKTHLDWRFKMCQWAYKVIDHFDLCRSCASLGMNFFDRYLEISRFDDDKENFQLIAATALYMAIKIQDEMKDGNLVKTPQKLYISFFVHASRGLFSDQDMIRMEKHILCTLNWRVNPSIPSQFSEFFFHFFPSHDCKDENDDQQENETMGLLCDVSLYLIEISTYDHILSAKMRPSVVAYSTLLVSLDSIDEAVITRESRSLFLKQLHLLTGLSPQSKEVMDASSRIESFFSQVFELDESRQNCMSSIVKAAGFPVKEPSTVIASCASENQMMTVSPSPKRMKII